MPRGVKKENLPSKLCEVCKRPFTWRKVWERCWDDVKTCSDRCKAERKKQNTAKAKEKEEVPASAAKEENANRVVKSGILDFQIPLLFSLCPQRFMALHQMQYP